MVHCAAEILGPIVCCSLPLIAEVANAPAPVVDSAVALAIIGAIVSIVKAVTEPRSLRTENRMLKRRLDQLERKEKARTATEGKAP